MPDGLGNSEQVRAIADQVGLAAASAAIREFVQTHPHFGSPAPKAEIPAPLKWAAIIASAVMTAAVTGACYWGVSTLNELQLTVREISTRQQTDTTGKEIDDLKARVVILEQERQKP